MHGRRNFLLAWHLPNFLLSLTNGQWDSAPGIWHLNLRRNCNDYNSNQYVSFSLFFLLVKGMFFLFSSWSHEIQDIGCAINLSLSSVNTYMILFPGPGRPLFYLMLVKCHGSINIRSLGVLAPSRNELAVRLVFIPKVALSLASFYLPQNLFLICGTRDGSSEMPYRLPVFFVLANHICKMSKWCWWMPITIRDVL